MGEEKKSCWGGWKGWSERGEEREKANIKAVRG